MQAIVAKCPGCKASVEVNSSEAAHCACYYCGIVFALQKPAREVVVNFKKVRTSGQYGKDVHIGSYILFACCLVVTAVAAFFAVRILMGNMGGAPSNPVPETLPYSTPVTEEAPPDYYEVDDGYYHAEDEHDFYAEISIDPPMDEPHYFGLHAAVNLYPYQVAIVDIFRYEAAASYGYIYVGIAFLFENISYGSHWLNYSQINVYVNGYYVARSAEAVYFFESSHGINAVGGGFAPGESLHVQHAIEVPIGTSEIVVEINDGAYGREQEVVIFNLQVP